MASIESQPKYLQLADTLAGKIFAHPGADGRIPPVRQIATEHAVSLMTAVRALQALRDRGLIHSVARSGSFLVHEEQSHEQWALVLHLTPGPFRTASGQVNAVGFEALARQTKTIFATDLFDLQEGAELDALRLQVRRAVDKGILGVFLLPARFREAGLHADQAFLGACAEADLPVVLIERNLRGEDQPLLHDLVGSDDSEGGRMLTHHLLGLGRKRIAFVTGSPCSSHNDRLAGYLFALHSARSAARGLAALEPIVLTQADAGSSRDAYAAIVDQLLAARADGVVCFTDYTALGIILELLRRGIAVPRDLAVCGFDDVPMGDSFAIGVTTYAFPSLAVAENALEVMQKRRANPQRPPVKIILPGKLIVRNSTCA